MGKISKNDTTCAWPDSRVSVTCWFPHLLIQAQIQTTPLPIIPPQKAANNPDIPNHQKPSEAACLSPRQFLGQQGNTIHPTDPNTWICLYSLCVRRLVHPAHCAIIRIHSSILISLPRPLFHSKLNHANPFFLSQKSFFAKMPATIYTSLDAAGAALSGACITAWPADEPYVCPSISLLDLNVHVSRRERGEGSPSDSVPSTTLTLD